MDASRKFLSEFIDCYKLSGALWNTASPDYSSRHMKLIAYTKLLKVMKKYKKDACVNDVRKKINTLRSNFRREMKRIKASEARGDECVYTPNLWWFEKFSFLRNLKNPKQSTNTNAKQEEIFVEELFLYDEEEVQEEDDPVNNLDVKLEEIKSKRHLEEPYNQPTPKTIKKQDENLVITYNALPPPSGGDTFDHMCTAWAGNLREMDKHQRIIAGRAISEIIFQGQVGVLTFDSIPKMPVNASFSSSQMMVKNTNSTRVSVDTSELNYTKFRRQSRENSPKPAQPTFSSVTLQNQQQINNSHQPSTSNQVQTNEYTPPSAMEQQTLSGQFYDQ